MVEETPFWEWDDDPLVDALANAGIEPTTDGAASEEEPNGHVLAEDELEYEEFPGEPPESPEPGQQEDAALPYRQPAEEPHSRQPRRRSRAVLLTAGLAVLGAGTIAAAFLSGGNASESKAPTGSPTDAATSPSSSASPVASPSPTLSSAAPDSPPAGLKVPNVVGESSTDAISLLAESGLTLGEEIPMAVDAELEPGTVVLQYPRGSEQHPPGTMVNLVVASRNGAKAVPDVTGKTVEAATSKIRAAGLAAAPTQTVDSTQPAGTIVEQFPPAGRKAPAEGKVLFLVSNGKSRMPDVTGLAERQAVSNLVAANLKVNVYARPDGENGTRVSSQIPAAGTYVSPGGTVSITLGQRRK